MSAADIACPACGETEALHGSRHGERIDLRCDGCGNEWTRDPRPSCPQCGGSDLVETPKAVAEKVRGDQMSIVGYTSVHLCRACDAATLESLARSKAPLPPDELPVKSRHGWQTRDR